MPISNYSFENQNLSSVKSEVAEILNLTNSLTENQQRELLAFARGYKCGTIAPKESA